MIHNGNRTLLRSCGGRHKCGPYDVDHIKVDRPSPPNHSPIFSPLYTTCKHISACLLTTSKQAVPCSAQLFSQTKVFYCIMQFLPDNLDKIDVRVRTLYHALYYADLEWPVFPLYTMYLKQGICTCHQGADCTSPAKHPVPVNGFKAATVKTEVIRQWWKKHPRANIGIATGHGLFVIDIDPRSGGSLEELNKRFAIPNTAMVLTGGEGWHLYFSYTGSLGNSASKLCEGIDTRGLGGYVVAPPSLHASGNYYTINQTLHHCQPRLSTPYNILQKRCLLCRLHHTYRLPLRW